MADIVGEIRRGRCAASDRHDAEHEQDRPETRLIQTQDVRRDPRPEPADDRRQADPPEARPEEHAERQQGRLERRCRPARPSPAKIPANDRIVIGFVIVRP